MKKCKICNSLNLYKEINFCYKCYVLFNKQVDEKLCGTCGEIKLKKHFISNRNQCKECNSIKQKNLRKNNLIKYRDRDRLYYKNNIIYYLFKSAKERAVKNNIIFSITKDDIRNIYRTKCPIFNIELFVDKSNSNSPTIDRIDPNVGYVDSNIRMISYKANRSKSNSSFKEYNMLLNNLLNILHDGVCVSSYELDINIKQNLHKAHERSNKYNLPFNIDEEYLRLIYPQNNRCPLLDIKLKKGVKKLIPNSPTLDRIVPEFGYIKGNVVFISHKANTMKSNLNIKEMKLSIKNWYNK